MLILINQCIMDSGCVEVNKTSSAPGCEDDFSLGSKQTLQEPKSNTLDKMKGITEEPITITIGSSSEEEQDDDDDDYDDDESEEDEEEPEFLPNGRRNLKFKPKPNLSSEQSEKSESKSITASNPSLQSDDEPVAKKMKLDDVTTNNLHKENESIKSNEKEKELICDKKPSNDDSDDDCMIVAVDIPKKKINVCVEETGITEYLDIQSRFKATIKQLRYADFMVNEIDTHGKTVHLVDMNTVPSDGKEPDKPPVGVTNGDWAELGLMSEMTEPEYYLPAPKDKKLVKWIHVAISKYHPQLLHTDTWMNGSKYIRCQWPPGELKIHQSGYEWPQPNWNLPSSAICNSCNYMKFVLFKENIDTQGMLKKICEHLKLSYPSCQHLKTAKIREFFQFADSKEKKSQSSQYITALRVPPRALIGLNQSPLSKMYNLAVGDFRYAQNPIKKDEFSGNHYTITLRNVTASNHDVDSALESLKSNGFINYCVLHSNISIPPHVIGRAIFVGNVKKAIDSILSKKKSDVIDDISVEGWYNDAAARLDTALSKGKTGWLALNEIPFRYRVRYVKEYQKYVWNLMVSRRIKEMGSKLVVGDLVMARSKQLTQATEGTKKSKESKASMLISSQKELDRTETEETTSIKEESATVDEPKNAVITGTEETASIKEESAAVEESDCSTITETEETASIKEESAAVEKSESSTITGIEETASIKEESAAVEKSESSTIAGTEETASIKEESAAVDESESSSIMETEETASIKKESPAVEKSENSAITELEGKAEECAKIKETQKVDISDLIARAAQFVKMKKIIKVEETNDPTVAELAARAAQFAQMKETIKVDETGDSAEVLLKKEDKTETEQFEQLESRTCYSENAQTHKEKEATNITLMDQSNLSKSARRRLKKQKKHQERMEAQKLEASRLAEQARKSTELAKIEEMAKEKLAELGGTMLVHEKKASDDKHMKTRMVTTDSGFKMNIVEITETEASEKTEASEISDMDKPGKINEKASERVPVLVTEGNMHMYSLQDLVLPLPGFRCLYPDHAVKAWYEEKLKEDGIDLQNLTKHQRRTLATLTRDVEYRPLIALPGDMSWQHLLYDDPTLPLAVSDIELAKLAKKSKRKDLLGVSDGKHHAVRLQIALPPGNHTVTMALREVCAFEEG